MSRKFTVAAAVAATLLVLGCTGTDRSPTGLRGTGPHLDLSAPPLEQIQDQIDKLFPSGGLRTAATAHLSNITADLDREKTENARKKTFALVNFLRQKQSTGQLLDPNGPTVAPTTGDAADALVSSLYLYVGLTPAGTPPTNVAVDAAIAVIGPSGGTVVTGGNQPNGAVVFPAGALTQYVTVTMERLPNPDGTNYQEVPYRKYPIAFEIRTVPAVTLPTDQKATVAVCTIEPGTEASGIPPRPSRLRLAHITASVPGGFELLPPGSSQTQLPSSCEDARLAAADPRPDGGFRLAMWKARRIGGRALDALTPATAYAGHGGLLGQTTTFSPFVPADPDAPVSVNVTPGSATIPVGGTQALAATALNSAGTDVTAGSVPVTWSSSNPAVATVDATSGVVTGVSGGTATITATIESASGGASVTVTSGPPSISALTLSTTTLTIGGAGASYTATILNPGPSAGGVVLQGYIVQGDASRAAGGIVLDCGSAAGVLPSGSCNMSFTANASNTTTGNGTLVPGSATFLLAAIQNSGELQTTLATRSVAVTLQAPPPPAPPLGFGLSISQGGSYVIDGPTGTSSWTSSDPSGVSVTPVAGTIPTALVTANFYGRAVTITAYDDAGRPLKRWQVNTGRTPDGLDVGSNGFIIAAWNPNPFAGSSNQTPVSFHFHAQICSTAGVSYDQCAEQDWMEFVQGDGNSAAYTLMDRIGKAFPAGYAGRWEVDYFADGAVPMGHYGWQPFARSP